MRRAFAGVLVPLAFVPASSRALSMPTARAKAKQAAQHYFADLFDARAVVRRCSRRNAFIVDCNVSAYGPGLNCRLIVRVRDERNNWVASARDLRC